MVFDDPPEDMYPPDIRRKKGIGRGIAPEPKALPSVPPAKPKPSPPVLPTQAKGKGKGKGQGKGKAKAKAKASRGDAR